MQLETHCCLGKPGAHTNGDANASEAANNDPRNETPKPINRHRTSLYAELYEDFPNKDAILHVQWKLDRALTRYLHVLLSTDFMERGRLEAKTSWLPEDEDGQDDQANVHGETQA